MLLFSLFNSFNNINVHKNNTLQTNLFKHCHYSIEDSDSEDELLSYNFNDPLVKDIFLNALKIYSNEKIPRKIAQEIINDQN